MLDLDHLTVIAPTLADGVVHVRDCLDLDVPFGTRHDYMGTHNHRLQLGGSVYLEVVALDPDGADPGRARWFGVDNQRQVRSDWEMGFRLRGWVARTDNMASVLATHGENLGECVALPQANPSFDFTIPEDGSLPLGGVAPSVIDHRGDPTSMDDIPDLGARLHSFTLIHPDPEVARTLYRELGVINPPIVDDGRHVRYRAAVQTPSGLKHLT